MLSINSRPSLDPLSWDRAGFDRQYLSHPDYNFPINNLGIRPINRHRPINSPSRTFGASADSIPLVPPRSPIIDPLPHAVLNKMSLMLIKPAIKSACHTLQATISNYKSLTE
uniref:Uncharacterized protein n=1 Tax=Heterorhabditis bacteriophora TaxID=37862 RepID=A0A1I7XWC4_HETBA